MKVRLFSGWSFPESSLQPMADSLRELQMDGSCWIGWSLGGIQALQLLSRESPRALVLLSSTARFCADGENWPGLPEAQLRALRKLFRRDPETALRQFHRLCAGNNFSEATLENRVRTSMEMDRRSLEQGLDLLGTTDARSVHSSLPILLLHGARDEVIPAAAAEATARLFPNARVIVNHHAAHDLPLSHAPWIADRLLDFIGAIA